MAEANEEKRPVVNAPHKDDAGITGEYDVVSQVVASGPQITIVQHRFRFVDGKLVEVMRMPDQRHVIR
jgi:hypothetical protein